MRKLLHRLKSAPPADLAHTSELDRENRRLKSATAGKKQIKLHIGCGPRVVKGWINIDLAFEPYEEYLKYYTDKFYAPDIRGTKKDFFAINVAAQPLPLSDNSVDVVFHEDFIEHLDQKEQILFLAESLRVLKKGGVHRVNTPDLGNSMTLHSSFKKGFGGVYQEEWDRHVHKNILTFNNLKELASIVGYETVIKQKRNQSKAIDLPLEYRPDPNDRPEEGNIFADLIK